MSRAPEWFTELGERGRAAQADELEPGEGAQEQEGGDQQAADVDAAGQAATKAAAQQQERMVPLATLVEERRRLQQMIEDERTRNRRFETLEEEIRRLRAERQPAPKPELQEVDYLEDPKGYVDARTGELVSKVKALEQTNQQLTEQQQRLLAEQALRRHVGATEAQFAREHPDYFDALGIVREVRAQQLQLVYPEAQPAQIAQQINTEELALAADLLAKGRNPCEVAYQYAQTLGYQPKTVQNRRNGQAPQTETPQTRQAVPGVDRRRLQGMGGQTAAGAGQDSELERLLEGGGDEFDQAMSELFPKRRR